MGPRTNGLDQCPNGPKAPIPDLPAPAPEPRKAMTALVAVPGLRRRDHVRVARWPRGSPQLGGYMRELERERVRTPCCTRRLVHDRQILTWTTWPSRLVLNGKPLVLNSCSMG